MGPKEKDRWTFFSWVSLLLRVSRPASLTMSSNTTQTDLSNDKRLTACARNATADNSEGVGMESPVPWQSDKRATSKWMLVADLYNDGGIKPVVKVVEDALGHLSPDASWNSTDRKLATRFFKKYDGEWFTVDRVPGANTQNYVELTDHAETVLDEIRLLDRGENQEGREPQSLSRVILGLGWVDEEKVDANTKFAKERLRDFFSRTNRVTTESQKSYLAQEMQMDWQTRREIMALKHNEGQGWSVESLHNRFTDLDRAKDTYGSFVSQLESAHDDHGHTIGTHLTLTTDPKLFDSIEEQYRSMRNPEKSTEDSFKEKAMDWIDYRLPDDMSRPLNVTKLELSDKGLVHVHVVLFGVDPAGLPDIGDLSEYAGERQGAEVCYNRIRWNHRKRRWMMETKAGNHVPIREYLLKDGIREMLDVADPETDREPRDMIRDGRQYWKLAFYLAYGASMFSGSPQLDGHAPIPNDSIPDMVSGIESLDALPPRIRQSLDEGDVVGGDRPAGEALKVAGPPPRPPS